MMVDIIQEDTKTTIEREIKVDTTINLDIRRNKIKIETIIATHHWMTVTKRNTERRNSTIRKSEIFKMMVSTLFKKDLNPKTQEIPKIILKNSTGTKIKSITSKIDPFKIIPKIISVIKS